MTQDRIEWYKEMVDDLEYQRDRAIEHARRMTEERDKLRKENERLRERLKLSRREKGE